MTSEIYDIDKQILSYQNAQLIKSQMSGSTMHQHYFILENLANSIDKDELNYLEIGIYEGGSLCFMMQNKKIRNVVGIDPFYFPGQLDNLNKNLDKFNLHQTNVKIIEKYSTDESAVTDLTSFIDGVDVLFIDGDHTHNGVIYDFETYHRFVNKGGYIVFDDYQDYRWSPEVRGAVDLILDKIKNGDYEPYKFEIIGSLPNITEEIVSDVNNVGNFNNEFIVKVVDK